MSFACLCVTVRHMHMYEWFSKPLSIAFSLLLYLFHLLLVPLAVRNLVRFYRSKNKINFFFHHLAIDASASGRLAQIIYHVCEAPALPCAACTEMMNRIHGIRRSVCVTTPSSNYIRFFVCSLLHILTCNTILRKCYFCSISRGTKQLNGEFRLRVQ